MNTTSINVHQPSQIDPYHNRKKKLFVPEKKTLHTIFILKKKTTPKIAILYPEQFNLPGDRKGKTARLSEKTLICSLHQTKKYHHQKFP